MNGTDGYFCADMRRSGRLLIFGLMLLVLSFGTPVPRALASGLPEEPVFDEAAALKVSQAAIGGRLGEYLLADRNGNKVNLSQYRGRPLLVNVIYSSCYHTCPVIVQTLARAVEATQDAIGVDAFAVITIGFDTDNDTPARMRAFARQQGVDLPGWKFLSTDKATMDKLSGELGFIYFPSPKGFDHLIQTTVVDQEGKIYRQIYGDDFDPPTVGEHLKDLIFGRHKGFATLDGLANSIRLFCTIYDPKSERYRFDYSIFIGLIIGFVSLSTIGFILVRAIIRLIKQGSHA